MPGDEGIPTVKNFRFSNIRVANCPILVDGVGIHPHKPLDGFLLANVRGSCTKGIQLANIMNADIRGVDITGLAGPLLGINNVTGKGLEAAVAIDAPKIPQSVVAPDSRFDLR